MTTKQIWERQMSQRWVEITPIRNTGRQPNLYTLRHFDDGLVLVPLVEPDIRRSPRDRKVEPNHRIFIIAHAATAKVSDTIAVVGMMTHPYSSWLAHLNGDGLEERTKTMIDGIGRENIPNRVYVVKGPRTPENAQFEVLRALRELNLEITALMIINNQESNTIRVSPDGRFEMILDKSLGI